MIFRSLFNIFLNFKISFFFIFICLLVQFCGVMMCYAVLCSVLQCMMCYAVSCVMMCYEVL